MGVCVWFVCGVSAGCVNHFNYFSFMLLLFLIFYVSSVYNFHNVNFHPTRRCTRTFFKNTALKCVSVFRHHRFFAVSPLPIQTVRSFITLPPLPHEDDFYFGNAETFLVPFLAVTTVLSLAAVVGLTVFMG